MGGVIKHQPEVLYFGGGFDGKGNLAPQIFDAKGWRGMVKLVS